MKTKLKFIGLALVALALLIPAFAIAQTITNAPPLPPSTESVITKVSTVEINMEDMGLAIAFVLLLGGVIKNFTPIDNKWIPLITWILGGLLYQWLAGGWTDPRQWMMALISVAGATGLHSATRSTVASASPGPLTLLLCAAITFGGTGCKNFFNPQDLKPVPVAEGQDSIVVNAQRVQNTSLFAYQQLVEFELANRAILSVQFSRAVDQVRAQFKPNWRASRKALEDYQAKRGVSLDDMNRVTAALSAAQTAMLELRNSQDAGAIASVITSISRLANNINALRSVSNQQP